MEKDDALLYHQLSHGEIGAFDALYRKYSGAVISFAMGITKNSTEAEDITHDVFLKIWEKRGSLSNIDNFKFYLFKTTKNTILNRIKRDYVRKKYLQSNDYLSSLREEVTPHLSIEVEELNLLLAATIDNMPKERKEVFLMSRQDNMSYKEIAEKLNVSPKTVQYHISKALAELRKVIKILLIFT